MTKNSYQKLKLRIAELEKDLDTVIERPDSYAAFIIRARHNIRRSTEKAVLMGDVTTVKMGSGLMHFRSGNKEGA